jgi:outer membrane protein assembly factor BamA
MAFLGLLVMPLEAQEIPLPIDSLGNATFADTSADRKYDYFVYPYIFYTPETQLAFGAGGMLYFRTGGQRWVRPSKVLLTSYYTSNNQYNIALKPTIHFARLQRDLLEMELSLRREQLKYYGKGPDTPEIDNPDYIMQIYRVYAEFGNIGFLFDDLHSGLILDYSPHLMRDKMQNPYLSDDITRGQDGGSVFGTGALLLLDNRNNIFYPDSGFYMKLRYVYNSMFLDADYDFQQFYFDVRGFSNLGDDYILAAQAYGEFSSGNVPFFKLPALGGDRQMRGFFFGRYRDNQYLTGQVELRKIFWWRLGGVIFAGLGDVQPRLQDFRMSSLKTSLGFGFRFVFDEKEKINLRMDIGFGEGGSNGVYFNMEEAF